VPIEVITFLVGIGIGAFIASNSPLIHDFLSMQKFREGLIEGLMRGQKIKNDRSKKHLDKKRNVKSK